MVNNINIETVRDFLKRLPVPAVVFTFQKQTKFFVASNEKATKLFDLDIDNQGNSPKKLINVFPELLKDSGFEDKFHSTLKDKTSRTSRCAFEFSLDTMVRTYDVILSSPFDETVMICFHDISKEINLEESLDFSKKHINLFSEITEQLKDNVGLETIFKQTCDGLTEIHGLYYCDLWLLKETEPDKITKVKYSSLNSKIVNVIQKVSGLNYVGLEMLLFEKCAMEPAYESGHTITFIDGDIVNMIRDIVPPKKKALRMLAGKVAKLLGAQCILIIPIQGQDSVIGHMGFSTKGHFDSVDIDSLQMIVDKISTIIEIKRSNVQQQQLADQLRQSQKLEAVGQLAGGIAHDFNNILTGILGNIQLALPQVESNSDLEQLLSEVSDSSLRAATLVKQLLAYSRKQVLSPKYLDMCELVKNISEMLRRTIGGNIAFITDLKTPSAWVTADATQMEQIILNMVVNAKDAITQKGIITITVESRTIGQTSWVHGEGDESLVILSIADNGDGMDDQTISHIYEPFFTTKDIGKGTGLGLSMVYGIVKQHFGYMNVTSIPHEGTLFEIAFPQKAEVVQKKISNNLNENFKGGDETILLVEDDQIVRKTTRKMLKMMGYKVIVAESGQDALEKFSNMDRHIDLLLTDVMMPEMNGRELAKRFEKVIPNLKVIYISGYSKEFLTEQNILKPNVILLPKPYSPKQLSTLLREKLG